MEYKYLRDFSGDNQLQGKQIHLNKKLKAIEGKPYHNYIKKSMDAYVETLPKQDSLNKQLRKALYTTIELFLFTVYNYGNLGKDSF